MRLLLLLCLLSLKLAIAGEPARLQFSRVGPTRIGLFLVLADGSNEHALLPANSLDYNPSFSADGKWIVFTSERNGSADIFRIHPDGSGLERLTPRSWPGFCLPVAPYKTGIFAPTCDPFPGWPRLLLSADSKCSTR